MADQFYYDADGNKIPIPQTAAPTIGFGAKPDVYYDQDGNQRMIPGSSDDPITNIGHALEGVADWVTGPEQEIYQGGKKALGGNLVGGAADVLSGGLGVAGQASLLTGAGEAALLAKGFGGLMATQGWRNAAKIAGQMIPWRSVIGGAVGGVAGSIAGGAAGQALSDNPDAPRLGAEIGGALGGWRGTKLAPESRQNFIKPPIGPRDNPNASWLSRLRTSAIRNVAQASERQQYENAIADSAQALGVGSNDQGFHDRAYTALGELRKQEALNGRGPIGASDTTDFKKIQDVVRVADQAQDRLWNDSLAHFVDPAKAAGVTIPGAQLVANINNNINAGLNWWGTASQTADYQQWLQNEYGNRQLTVQDLLNLRQHLNKLNSQLFNMAPDAAQTAIDTQVRSAFLNAERSGVRQALESAVSAGNPADAAFYQQLMHRWGALEDFSDYAKARLNPSLGMPTSDWRRAGAFAVRAGVQAAMGEVRGPASNLASAGASAVPQKNIGQKLQEAISKFRVPLEYFDIRYPQVQHPQRGFSIFHTPTVPGTTPTVPGTPQNPTVLPGIGLPPGPGPSWSMSGSTALPPGRPRSPMQFERGEGRLPPATPKSLGPAGKPPIVPPPPPDASGPIKGKQGAATPIIDPETGEVLGYKSDSSGMPKFAAGSPVIQGPTPAIVGEAGPEVVHHGDGRMPELVEGPQIKQLGASGTDQVMPLTSATKPRSPDELRFDEQNRYAAGRKQLDAEFQGYAKKQQGALTNMQQLQYQTALKRLQTDLTQRLAAINQSQAPAASMPSGMPRFASGGTVVPTSATGMLNMAGSGEDIIRGSSQVPLDNEGIKQAHSLSQNVPGQFHKIYSSNLQRALQTAQAVSSSNPQAGPIVPTDALQPWHLGELEGQPTSQVLHTIHSHIVDKPDVPVPGRGPLSTADGESFNSFRQRTLGQVISMLRESDANPGSKTAAITHYRDVKLVRAWLAAGARPDGAVDPQEMVMHGAGDDPASLHRLYRDHTGMPTMETVKPHASTDLKPGVYLLRHGKTALNGPSSPSSVKRK